MDVAIDPVGNLRGFSPGASGSLKRLMLGSHLDTVPNAGAYDGVLGVVLGIALVEALRNRKLPFGIEVVGFSEEEGVRFGVPFIGSRALTGEIDSDLLKRADSSNITVEEAIRNFGLDPSCIGEAVIDDRVFAYLEFHIEQGPVLESLDKPLGIVEAIAGQSRLALVFSGKANHAGTTPMHLRQDALAGAAEWIGLVEAEAKATPGLVATVGFVEVKPGAGNVIPGEARAGLDVRHACDGTRAGAVERLLTSGADVARRRGLSMEWAVALNQPAIGMDTALIESAERAISAAGLEPFRMISGAGHDAMIMAQKLPSAMIFLRSPGGISHHPDETVLVEDVEAALSAGRHFIEQLAR